MRHHVQNWLDAAAAVSGAQGSLRVYLQVPAPFLCKAALMCSGSHFMQNYHSLTAKGKSEELAHVQAWGLGHPPHYPATAPFRPWSMGRASR